MCLVPVIIIVGFACCLGDEFAIDDRNCLLQSKNHSIIVDLSRSGTSRTEDVFDSAAGSVTEVNLCPWGRPRDDPCPPQSYVCLHQSGTKAGVDLGSNITSITYEYTTLTFFIHIESHYGKGMVYITCNEFVHDSQPLITSDNEDSENKKTDLFTYSISWSSAFACPMKQYAALNSCILYTKEFSYDLRPLQYSSDLVFVQSEHAKFVLSICRDVRSVPGCTTASLCLLGKNSTRALATSAGFHLRYLSSPSLSLIYNNYIGKGKTVIQFICSETSFTPVINFIDKNDEYYDFNVNTTAACLPRKMDCLIQDPSTKYFYDLSRLHHFNENWDVKLPYGSRLIFSLCRSLNYVPGIPCTGSNHFACLTDGHQTFAFADTAQTNVISSGNLSIAYKGLANASEKFTLNVSLLCSDSDSYPSFVGQKGNTYVLEWKSTNACPSEMSERGEDCRVSDLYADSSFHVDISRLHRRIGDYNVPVGNESFRINICGTLSQSCSENSEASVCYKNSQGKEFSIGELGSSQLTFKDGQFLMELEGEPCTLNVTRSKVFITFLCEYFEEDSTAHSLYPEFFSKGNECEFHFIWKSTLICEKRLFNNCTLSSEDKFFDLSPLRRSSENYEIHLNSSSALVLNVCHSLIPGYRLRCPPGTGACLLNSAPSHYGGERAYEILGLVSKMGDLEYSDGQLRLKYLNGGICEDRSHGSHVTSIHFICDQTSNNTLPVFIGFEKCEYKFNWTTQFACPILVETSFKPPPAVTEASIIHPSSIKDSKNKDALSKTPENSTKLNEHTTKMTSSAPKYPKKSEVTPTTKPKVPSIKTENCDIFTRRSNLSLNDTRVDEVVGSRGSYALDICDLSPLCNGNICKSFARGPWMRFAQEKNVTRSPLGVSIFYISSEEPQNENCGAKVEITCDPSSTLNKTELIKETDCYIHVRLGRGQACSPQSLGSPAQPKPSTVRSQDTPSYTVRYVLSALLLFSVVLLLSALYWFYRRRKGLSPSVQNILRYQKVKNGYSSTSFLYDDTADENTIIFELTSRKIE